MKRPLLKALTRPNDTAQPVFLIAGLGGHVLEFRRQAAMISADWHVTGILYPLFAGGHNNCPSIEELSAEMAVPLQDIQGPIILTGYSIGGAFCYQIASELRKAGKSVAVVFIDTSIPAVRRKRGRLARGFRKMFYLRPRAWLYPGAKKPAEPWQPDDERVRSFGAACRKAGKKYHPPVTDIPVVMIRADSHRRIKHWIEARYWPSSSHGWSRVAPVAGVVRCAGNHVTIMRNEHVSDLAEAMDKAFTIAKRALAETV